MRGLRSLFVPLLILCSSVIPGAEAAEDKKLCVTAFESAQQLRNEGKLREASSQLEVCSRDACPKIIHAPCRGWLPEVQAEIPSLTIAVVDPAGNALSGVRVSLDGREAESGRDLPLDPGSYTVRAEKAGFRPALQRVDLAKKEKGRKITLTLEADKAAPKSSAPPVEPPTPASRGTSPLVYALGGVGVVGLGVFAWQGLAGRSEERSLKSSCAPRCSPEQIREVERRYLFADISLGVGVGPQGASLVVSRGF
jgi:hypothetical protein